MQESVRRFALVLAVVAGGVVFTFLDKPADAEGRRRPERSPEAALRDHVLETIEQGRQTFRFDTFGDEAFWGDTLKLHQAIEGKQRSAAWVPESARTPRWPSD